MSRILGFGALSIAHIYVPCWMPCLYVGLAPPHVPKREGSFPGVLVHAGSRWTPGQAQDKYSPNCREELWSKIINQDSSIENFRSTGSIPELEAFKIMMAKGCKLSPLLWDAERGNNLLTGFLPWLLFQTPLLLNLCLSLLQAVFFVSVFQLPCKKLGYARVAKTALSISAVIWKAWKKNTLFTKTGDCKFPFKQWSLSDQYGCWDMGNLTRESFKTKWFWWWNIWSTTCLFVFVCVHEGHVLLQMIIFQLAARKAGGLLWCQSSGLVASDRVMFIWTKLFSL